MNGLGITAFGYGALEMAVGPDRNPMSWQLALWLCVLVLAIASTSHIQDLKDQEGDAAAGRRTVPIVYGDAAARWSLVLGLAVWTAVICGIWAGTLAACAGPVGLAAAMVFRLLRTHGAQEDKKTYMLWTGWLLAVHLIPALN